MGKLRVKKPFVDKYDSRVSYRPGQVITIDDPEREKDLISRGLCAAVKGKTSDKKDEVPTQEPAPGAETTETSEEETANQSEE